MFETCHGDMFICDCCYAKVGNKMKIVCEGCKEKFDCEKEFKEHSLKTGHTIWAKEERKGW
jgi:hypothetical protein